MQVLSTKIYGLLTHEMNAHWERVDRDVLGPVSEAIAAKAGSQEELSHFDLLHQILLTIDETLLSLEQESESYQRFNLRHSRLSSAEEINQNILLYAEELGRTKAELVGDRRAFKRHFGQDTMVARFQRKTGEHERATVILLRTIPRILDTWPFDEQPITEEILQNLPSQRLLRLYDEYTRDERIPVEALRAFSALVKACPPHLKRHLLPADAEQLIIRSAQDIERDPWCQIEGLRLLHQVSIRSFREIAWRLFGSPSEDDQAWVRRRTVDLVLSDDMLEPLREKVMRDPSPMVRQRIAEQAHLLDNEQTLEVLRALSSLEETETAVRGSALMKLGEQALTAPDSVSFGKVLAEALLSETDSWCIRVSCRIIAETHRHLSDEMDKAQWFDLFYGALNTINLEHDSISVRRWAAHTREQLVCEADENKKKVLTSFQTALRNTRIGKSGKIKIPEIEDWDDQAIGRVLAVGSQEDFGADVHRSKKLLRFTRGDRMGFRLWRFFYEFQKPSPDKRQAFRHTIGRLYDGHIRIPSPLLSEMSMTKVPGEPYTISDEAGWRPMLPLVDEVISAFDRFPNRKALTISTSEGTTVLSIPTNTLKRLRAQNKLNTKFDEYALARNTDPAGYVAMLRQIGIGLEFIPHPGEKVEPEIHQWFHTSAAVSGFAGLESVTTRIRDYFYSAYANSLEQLFVFLLCAFLYFAGRHVYLNQIFFRLRNKVPLIVGGWGTRGKSGTERIKAALFNAMGHRMVSKTTGCEAMFLYADSFGKTHELFLFRPYDKATIWEQVNIVQLSARLRSHVFLWECMGLTPAYINIIQRQWMKDDIATIVNTYPDHEDLQGPAGINIPQVMTYFIRKGGHCITSEQQMTPILEQSARELGSAFTTVGWLEPGLLTEDMLDRFPYAEHPNNIALVKELGNALSLDEDFSVKEMADRVVPDLGVLKVYAPAAIRSRQLQFVNGCSANERFGALGNWTRLEFDKQDPIEEPGVWVSVVVNNRADRIARSRVFAAILAEDIEVDRIFLIGSNLQGMMGYTREAFDGVLEQIDFSSSETPQADQWRNWTRKMRLPTSREEVDTYIAVIDDGDEKEPFIQFYETAYSEYEALAANVSSGDAWTSKAKDQLRAWFERKFVIVQDYFSTGDQTIHRIVNETPPGYTHKVMGMQNIKGTGLDFVYRFQAWDLCYNACQKIKSRKLKVAREGLSSLSAFTDYGLVCEEEVLDAIQIATKLHVPKDRAIREQLELIETTMQKTLEGIKSNLGTGDTQKSASWISSVAEKFLTFLERVLDGGDAIRRRRIADQVYRDMANLRISPAKAAGEIQRMNKRQKGGWLKKDIAARRQRRRG